jgi:hypothetical protein
MPVEARLRYDAELSRAKATDDTSEARAALEVAHILSQPWAGRRVRCHLAMLHLALSTRDRCEIKGQLIRTVMAGPGSLLGRYPVGNTGRANVPATRPMPVSTELAALISGNTP